MNKHFKNWAQEHLLGLFIFNSILMLLVLLHNAGYFHPFFLISVNFIAISGLVLSVFLLGANSRAMFLTTLVFWLLAGFFKITFVDIWAERSALYAFNAFVIGVVIFFLEMLPENIRRFLNIFRKK